MAFERVAQRSELPKRGGLRISAQGIAIALFPSQGGDGGDDEIYALEDRCPHQGVPLSDGELRGRTIECRAHGWCFDLASGFRPGFEDGFPIPRFPVRIDDDGSIWIDVAEPLNLRRRR